MLGFWWLLATISKHGADPRAATPQTLNYQTIRSKASPSSHLSDHPLISASRPSVPANWLLNYEPEPLGNGPSAVVRDACGIVCANTTKNGFQTTLNLFDRPTGLFADLDQIIKHRIENYRRKFSSEDCTFIRLLPKNISLFGWFVRFLKGGHQTEHIHSSGWLSGVFYLQVPNFSKQEEGYIEFGLWGYDYPKLNRNYPKKRLYPKSEDIILFPSSLFHKTIPFSSNEERMCIAFDVLPT